MTIVRDATPDDAESIGEVHAEAWRIGYNELFPPALLEAAVDLRRRMWVGLVGDPALGGTLLVAEEAGEVVGFIHFGPASGNDEIGEVYGLYAHPSSWGTARAQALMDRAVASLAESFTLAVLWTHAEAERARRFYAKSRWTETGKHRQENLWDGMAFPAANTSEFSCRSELVTSTRQRYGTCSDILSCLHWTPIIRALVPSRLAPSSTRTLAATPSPSVNKPRRRCSVPT